MDLAHTPVALITGAARRVGAKIVETLHAQGYRIALHYRHNLAAATQLSTQLNALRPDSVTVLQANFANVEECIRLGDTIADRFGRLDVLVNNASSFFPTPFGQVTVEMWHELQSSNLTGPFFLTQQVTPLLRAAEGCVVNIVDIHATRPLHNYPVYCIAKAGLVMLTKSLAKELGPHIRVNAIAPGAVLWPEQENQLSSEEQQKIIAQTALARAGSPEDIAKTVLFLIQDAPYITGQILAVDGGRSLGIS
jgi:pteridine reductase